MTFNHYLFDLQRSNDTNLMTVGFFVGWVQIEKHQKIQKYGKESASDLWISGSKYIQRFKDLEKKNTLNFDRTWLKTKRKEDDIIISSQLKEEKNPHHQCSGC